MPPPHRCAFRNLYTGHVQTESAEFYCGVQLRSRHLIAVFIGICTQSMFRVDKICAVVLWAALKQLRSHRGAVVFLWWSGGVFVVVFWNCLWWFGCVFVVVWLRFCGVVVFLWRCCCFFCGGLVVFVWLCFCGGAFVAMWLCFCGGVVVFLFLPRLLERRIGEGCCRECWREVLEKIVAEKCCREVL